MSLAETLAGNRRLIVLRALAQVTGKSLNEAVLKSSLAAFGHRVGADVVRADMAWLERHGLIRLDKLAAPVGDLWVAALTQPGLDVAQGAAEHPGVDTVLPE